MQEKWEREKVFEVDAPSLEDTTPKFLATFPYPYMNGRLHLGHVFTLSKAEFAVGYERLKGKNAIFPFGLHCTGMPIRACADKIKYEIETYGNPPNFPIREKEEESTEKVVKADDLITKKGKSKKSKANAKKSDVKQFQWEIMEGSDIPKEEIPSFSEAEHWLEYFPPLAVEDLKYIGSKIDWRRSFITTDKNPYYDSFVRWQFLKIKEKAKIKFGERFTVFSPKDNGPCMDHDRQIGEGVLPTEYVLIKQEVLKPYPKVIESIPGIEGKKVYMVPATLRPETMFGQTNCWVLPSGDYGAFLMKNDEVFICTERSALNLSFQKQSEEWGKPNCLASFKGSDIIGAAIKAPLTKYEKIYVWPMFNVSTSKTTGVVTSVPSDSPHDYVAYRDVLKKKDLREKFGLTDDMVLPFELIPIIECPSLGNVSAKKVVEDMKIASQSEEARLEEAKTLVYNKGFYEGFMIVDGYHGRKSEDIRKEIRESLIEQGLALIYSEPSDRVVSRSNDECVVALIDQWFIEYGEEEWKKTALECLEKMETYSEEVRNLFMKSFDWMTHWACSRTYGLGTNLPWDDSYLIDSLSDSTIYMAYYTIAHILHSDLYGLKKGSGNINPSSMTPEVYDFIFLGKDKPKETDIKDETLDLMRREFMYWYPVDLRVSGKDLVPNHLLFWIYNHVLFFQPSQWPKGVRANGHILLDGKKMAKSEGNFITLRKGVDLFTADGTRFALADAGDGVDDANFAIKTADGAILKIHTLIEWVKDVLKTQLRDENESYTYTDEIFLNEMRATVELVQKSYERMEYKEVIKNAFYTFQIKREKYRIRCDSEKKNMHSGLIKRWIKTQAIILSPICPHFSEYVWSELLKEEKSIMYARWPEREEVDRNILIQDEYIERLLHQWRIDSMTLKKKIVESNGVPTMEIKIFKSFPKDIINLKKLYEKLYRDLGNNLPQKKDFVDAIRKDKDLNKILKRAMGYIDNLSSEFAVKGEEIFKLDIGFDEKSILELNHLYIKESISVDDVIILEDDNNNDDDDANWAYMPGKPSMSLRPYLYNNSTTIVNVGDVVKHKTRGEGTIVSTENCRYPYQVKVKMSNEEVILNINTITHVKK